MTAEILWMNIPLMLIAFAIWAGVPLWLVIRHPDRDPRETRVAQARPIEARALLARRPQTAPQTAPRAGSPEIRELVPSR